MPKKVVRPQPKSKSPADRRNADGRGVDNRKVETRNVDSRKGANPKVKTAEVESAVVETPQVETQTVETAVVEVAPAPREDVATFDPKTRVRRRQVTIEPQNRVAETPQHNKNVDRTARRSGSALQYKTPGQPTARRSLHSVSAPDLSPAERARLDHTALETGTEAKFARQKAKTEASRAAALARQASRANSPVRRLGRSLRTGASLALGVLLKAPVVRRLPGAGALSNLFLGLGAVSAVASSSSERKAAEVGDAARSAEVGSEQAALAAAHAFRDAQNAQLNRVYATNKPAPTQTLAHDFAPQGPGASAQ